MESTLAPAQSERIIRSFGIGVDIPLINPVAICDELSLGFIDVPDIGSEYGCSLQVNNMGSFYSTPMSANPSPENRFLLPHLANEVASGDVAFAGAAALMSPEARIEVECLDNAEFLKLSMNLNGSPSVTTSPPVENETDIIVMILTPTRCYPIAFETKDSLGFKRMMVNGIGDSVTRTFKWSTSILNIEGSISVVVFESDHVYTMRCCVSDMHEENKLTLFIFEHTLRVHLTDLKLDERKKLSEKIDGVALFRCAIFDSRVMGYFLLTKEKRCSLRLDSGCHTQLFNKTTWSSDDPFYANLLFDDNCSIVHEEHLKKQEHQQMLMSLGCTGTQAFLTGTTVHRGHLLLRPFITVNNNVMVFQKYVKAVLTLHCP